MWQVARHRCFRCGGCNGGRVELDELVEQFGGICRERPEKRGEVGRAASDLVSRTLPGRMTLLIRPPGLIVHQPSSAEDNPIAFEDDNPHRCSPSTTKKSRKMAKRGRFIFPASSVLGFAGRLETSDSNTRSSPGLPLSSWLGTANGWAIPQSPSPSAVGRRSR